MAMQQLLAFASLLLLWPARRASAAEYVVGDVGYGWDSGSGVNYAAWARAHAFAVGDVLGELTRATACSPRLGSYIFAHDDRAEFRTDPCDLPASCVQFSST
jgi:hypothetical protein